MKLEVQSIWTTDLNLPPRDVPGQSADFKVGVQVSIGEADTRGGEVFSLVVSSPSMSPHIEPGCFASNTLVLDAFDWSAILQRIETEIMRCESCGDWATAIRQLQGVLRHDEATHLQ